MEAGNEKIKSASSETEAAEQPVSRVEAQQVAEKLKQEPQVVERVSSDKSMLAEFARKMGKPMRVLAFAFSMLLAKEAMADEPKAGAKVEMQQINLDEVKQRYQVPDEVKKLAEYESPVELYMGVVGGIQDIVDHWKNLDDGERKEFLKAIKDVPDGATYAKSNSSEGRLAIMGYMEGAAKVIANLQEISHLEPIDVAQNGK